MITIFKMSVSKTVMKKYDVACMIDFGFIFYVFVEVQMTPVLRLDVIIVLQWCYAK